MDKIRYISVAASKSYLQRAIAIAALADGESSLNQFSWSNDALVAKGIVEDLGCTVSEINNSLIINNKGLDFKNTSFNAGESGLSVRMFSPILALSNKLIAFSGQGSLLTRPVGIITEALSLLSVNVESNNGLLPIEIKGPIKSGNIEMDASLSSQILTGLLIVLPLLKGDSTIEIRNLRSKPYIDMTLSIMAHFGVFVEHNNYKVFKIKGEQKYQAKSYSIEGDWSGAAFFLVFGALKHTVEIINLDFQSVQADKAIVIALRKVGAEINILKKGIRVGKGQLNPFDFDATDCPDLFPPLVCLASQCKGVSKIKGISRLKHKESDRALVLMQEFAKMGVNISLKDDCMFVLGSEIKACVIDSHNDHRIAMAAGIMNVFTFKDARWGDLIS